MRRVKCFSRREEVLGNARCGGSVEQDLSTAEASTTITVARVPPLRLWRERARIKRGTPGESLAQLLHGRPLSDALNLTKQVV